MGLKDQTPSRDLIFDQREYEAPMVVVRKEILLFVVFKNTKHLKGVNETLDSYY